MSDDSDDVPPKHRMIFGRYEEAIAMVGYEAPARRGQVDVSESMIQLYCGISEDANPSYWDRDYAGRRWGGIVSPPGMLFSWTASLSWRPGLPQRVLPLCLTVPLPGDTVINARQEAELFAPMRVGDRLTMRERVDAVSPEKASHLGAGHFVTTKATFEHDDGVAVGTLTNSVFRYLAAGGAGR